MPIHGTRINTHVIERIFVDRNGRDMESAVTVVKNRVDGPILKVMDNLLKPKVEFTLRLNNASSPRGPASLSHIPDQRNFSGKTEDTLLMTESNRTDLYSNYNRNNETRANETIKNGDFPILKSNPDRQTHTHQNRNQLYPGKSKMYWLF